MFLRPLPLKLNSCRFLVQCKEIKKYSVLSNNSTHIPGKNEQSKHRSTPNLMQPSRSISSENLKKSYSDLFKSITESESVSAVKDGLLAVHDFTGLPWAGTIVLTTLVLRSVVTFPLGVYQQYVLARLELVKKEMAGIAEELKMETALAIKKFGWTEREAKIAYKASLKTQWRKLIERDNCHPLKSVLVVFIQLPAWIMLSLALRCMSYAYGPDPSTTATILGQLNHEGWGWFSNLLIPDATGILPLSVTIINLVIIELQAATKATHTRPQRILTNVFRGFAIVSFPIALSVPSSMSLYWAVSSGLALTQNVLLMSPRVRRIFNIPITASHQPHPYANAWRNFKSKWSWKRIILIRNPFTSLGQRYWITRCLRDFPRKPNKRNVDINPETNKINDLWTDFHDFSKSLRWVTLGFHHNWDTKVYTDDNRTVFPSDLSLMCQHIASALGYPQYIPQAAIVNFYQPGTTLSGHVDKSEIDLEAPLISISFGQSAIFLIGGTTLESEPTPILLQSGDILIMEKQSRLCYHAVPRICSAATTPWNQNSTTIKMDSCDGELADKLTEDDFWRPFKNYVEINRINVNVRQVLPRSQQFVILES